jgi:hypothetical protein
MWERCEDVCNVGEGAPVEPLLATNAEHAPVPSDRSANISALTHPISPEAHACICDHT